MRKIQYILAVFTALAMLLSFAACGSTPASEQASSITPPEQTEAVPTPEPPEADPVVPASSAEEVSTMEAVDTPEETPTFVSLDLPLTEEPVTLEMWASESPMLSAYGLKMQDLSFYHEMEKRTGVTLDITSVSFFTASDNFNLLMASGDYPDMIDSFQRFYTKSADNAIDEGIIVDLQDYLEEYMPNYKAALDSDQSFWLDSLTQSGALPSANMLFAVSEGPSKGLMIREDWLEECGLEIPSDYDDMEQVLEAFKNKYSVAAMALDTNGQSIGISAGLTVRELNTMDPSQAAFLNVDGVVSYCPATEGYREYLDMVHDWYEKGYIWKDFVSEGNNNQNYVLSGQLGVVTGIKDGLDSMTSSLQEFEPDASVIAIKALRKDPEEVLKVRNYVENVIYGTAVTASCENKELACRWLDYCYSPEGQILTNYGIEGEGLQYDENGNPEYTDLVLHNEIYNGTFACSVYSQYGGSMLCYSDRTFPAFSDRVLDALACWDFDTQEWMYPTKVTMSTEQGEEYNNIVNDLNSYVAEMTLKFIVGDAVLDDSSWDEYIGDLESMGLEQCVSIKQEALDSYLSMAQQ